MIEFVLHTEQAGCDITKALPIGQLSKEQAKILIETGERLNLIIATVSLDASTKMMVWQMFLQLSENGFSCIHRSFLFGHYEMIKDSRHFQIGNGKKSLYIIIYK
jgi:hypothetical protein